jgi:hypothetical protein
MSYMDTLNKIVSIFSKTIKKELKRNWKKIRQISNFVLKLLIYMGSNIVYYSHK